MDSHTKGSAKGKRLLPSVPTVHGSISPACLKSVTFNEEIRKASVGGTESISEIDSDSISISLNFDSKDGQTITVKSPSKAYKENTDPNDVFITVNDQEGLAKAEKTLLKSESPGVHVCEKKLTCKRDSKDNWVVSEETNCKPTRTPSKTPMIKTPLKTPTVDGKFKITPGSLSARSKNTPLSVTKSEGFLTPVRDQRRVTVEGTPIPCPDLNGGEVFCSPASMRTPIRTPNRRYTLDDKILQTPECYSAVQMDIPGYDLNYKNDFDLEDSSSVTVAVRVRPFMPR